MRELLRLKRYLLRYKYHYLFGIIALIAIDLLQLIIPRILKRAIDGLATGVIDLAGLGRYFLIILLIALLIAIGRFFWRYLIIGSSRRVERHLRTDFYKHLLTLDFTYFDQHKTGDLMAHAVNDINAVRMALGFGFIILIDVLILGVAALILMVHISPKLTMLAIIPFPIIALFSTRFGRIIHRLFEMVQAAFAQLTERVRESLSGIRVVKLFAQEETEMAKFDNLSQGYVEKNKRLIRVWSMFFPVMILLGMVGQVIVILVGGRYVIFGEISIGSFVAFMAYLSILIWPMMAIGWTVNLFQRGAASQRRLNRIFIERPQIKDGRVPIERLQGEIEFCKVTLTYPGKEVPALNGIDLHIHPKEFIGITGPVASGKTSLVALILRLYEPDSGTIMIDGHRIEDLKISDLRRNIAYVPQDTFLFSDTIRNNLLLGKRDATEAEIEQAIRTAQIYDEIREFPQGLDTVIGERGVTLQNADRIYVLDRGRVVEAGRHEELIQSRGLYYQIYERQKIELRLEQI